jgi:hypothetical protein
LKFYISVKKYLKTITPYPLINFERVPEKYSIKEKSIIIWGLAGCNCDAIAVRQGAEKVYAVDYNKSICEYPGIE